MKDKARRKRKVRIEYVGGGPQDGKTYILDQEDIPTSAQPPYREEAVGNRIHVYEAKNKYEPADEVIKLTYVGFVVEKP